MDTWTRGFKTAFVNKGTFGAMCWIISIPSFDLTSFKASRLFRVIFCLLNDALVNSPFAIAMEPSPWCVSLPSNIAMSWSILSETYCKKEVPSGR